MTNTAMNWSRYQERIRAVIEYIHEHHGENLSSDVLAEVAHLSPYHWHRIYKAITGESAAATVKRCRMHSAAATLIRTDMPVVEVGVSVGFPDVHSFTRTFKQFYGVAPGQFRAAQTEPDTTDNPAEPMDSSEQAVRLINRPAARMIGQWHNGDYMAIGVTFEKVMAQCAIAGILPENPRTMGLYLADPEYVGEAELRSFAGVVVNDAVEVPEPLIVYEYPAGRFAVLTHHGPYALLSNSYDWLYCDWLPASGEAVRDQPCAEVYLNSPIDKPPQELRTEICMPVQ